MYFTAIATKINILHVYSIYIINIYKYAGLVKTIEQLNLFKVALPRLKMLLKCI